MKKLTGWIIALFLISATAAFAGGDQNQHRYDGSRGNGQVKQHRVNK